MPRGVRWSWLRHNYCTTTRIFRGCLGNCWRSWPVPSRYLDQQSWRAFHSLYHPTKPARDSWRHHYPRYIRSRGFCKGQVRSLYRICRIQRRSIYLPRDQFVPASPSEACIGRCLLFGRSSPIPAKTRPCRNRIPVCMMTMADWNLSSYRGFAGIQSSCSPIERWLDWQMSVLIYSPRLLQCQDNLKQRNIRKVIQQGLRLWIRL